MKTRKQKKNKNKKPLLNNVIFLSVCDMNMNDKYIFMTEFSANLKPEQKSLNNFSTSL